MFQPRKYKKKELLEIFRTRNDNLLLALIDSLWREYPAQWKEQKLSLSDEDKTDPIHLDYDPRYEYAKNDFKNADGTQTTSYSTANGFGNKVRADFAQVFGFFNYALSMFQTVMGPYGEIPEGQTPDAWVNTDLLFTLCNGKDELNRSNVLEVFKSGLARWHNAQVIGAYEHINEGEPAPELIPGLIQYTAENGFECVKEDLLWHPFGESAYEIAVRNGFVGTEIQWLESLNGDDGLSAYEVALANGFVGTEAEWLESLNGADGDDGSPGTDGDDGLSAYEVALANGFVGTEAEWLESLQGDDGDPGVDTFIELTDTPASYPATNKGQLVKQSGAESVGFAAKIGEDINGVWLSTGSSRSEGGDIFNAGYADLVAGEWYHIVVTITGMTTGQATLEVNGNTYETFYDNGTFHVYDIAVVTGSNTVEVVGDVDFDGTVSSIQVYPVTFSKGSKIYIKDAAHANLAEIEAFKDEAGDILLKLSDELIYNITKKKIAFGDSINSGGKFFVKTTDGNAVYGWSENGYGGLFSHVNAFSLSIFENVIIDEDGCFRPARLTSSSLAPNNSIYRLDDDKLYWKDINGTVHDLTQSGGGVPGTETLSGTSVTVSWNGNTTATLTLTGATTLTFGTPSNYVKRLFVTGDYSLTLPASAEVLSGDYAGTKTNIIDLIPAPGGTVYVTIN